MNKKFLVFFVCAILTLSCFSIVACNKDSGATDIIAVVTDAGELFDNGFNEGAYIAVKNFADTNGKVVKYYQPDQSNGVSDEDRVVAMRKAITDGAKIIVAPGALQATALKIIALENPDIKFIFVDGTILLNDNQPLTNVTAITFREQESGFLAGYASVKEGYTQLGGTFGGGGINAACNRFAYGYVQGAIAAAENKQINVKISYKYGEYFSESEELTSQISEWYTNGTKVVFSCGGAMFLSVKAAAETSNRGLIIGVDVDQSPLSSRVITSAIKNVQAAVSTTLSEIFYGEWDSRLAGKEQSFGIAQDAIYLPTEEDSWKFKTFSLEDYFEIYNTIKTGALDIVTEVQDDCNNAAWWQEKASELNEKYGTFVSVSLEN